VAYLVDTNILVYRFDPRFPDKQRRATELLREGIRTGEARMAHQAVVEFVAATTRARPRGAAPLLDRKTALGEAEELLAQFTILYPVEAILRLAIRAVTTYSLGWFDAQMWACAEHHGLSPLFTEDLQHDALIGTVHVVDPFR
jgi:predicted nucleic acid-binding protein